MATLRQEVKAFGGKYIHSGISETLHPAYVFWMWLRKRLIIGLILFVTHLIALTIGVIFG